MNTDELGWEKSLEIRKSGKGEGAGRGADKEEATDHADFADEISGVDHQLTANNQQPTTNDQQGGELSA
ncbi:MAG: hypothetical protein RBT03_04475 [Kiritimatiellia bacterium]|jgi:hypothetical protein|nr:hypothetical protein [Kiritimatiellia bacterium]